MVERVTGGKGLSAEMVQQVIAKTDGVPLFVEELTKSVVESVGAPGVRPCTRWRFLRPYMMHSWRGWIACLPCAKSRSSGPP